MSGCFYAYASASTARQSNPELFTEIDGEWHLTGAVLRSTRGIWIDCPEADENGDTIVEGTRSKPYVFITCDPLDGREAARIDPECEQGFS